MKNNLLKIFYLLLIAFIMLPFVAKAQLVVNEMPLKVVEAGEWDEVQRNNGTSGWISGDGQMTIPMDGVDSIGHAQHVKTFWINSDSRFCAELDPFNLRVTDGRAFINHTVAIMNQVNQNSAPGFEDMDYWFGANNDKVTKGNLFPIGHDHAWTIDGWADGDTVYAFLLDKDKVDGVLNDVGVHMVKIPIIKDADGEIINADYSNYKYEEYIPWLLRDPDLSGYTEPKTVMASCIHDNTVEGGATLNADGYIYNYGVRKLKTSRNVVLSRVLRENFTNWDAYEYWNHETQTWTNDSDVLWDGRGNIVNRVGGIFSITPITTGVYKGKYLLVTIRKQDDPAIAYRIGESLTGPFSDEYVAYGALKEMDAYGTRDVNFYNGKAHPHISNPGELLISYSANRKETTLTTDKNRVRFIKLKLDELAEEAPLFIVSEGAGNNTSASGYTSTSTKPNKGFDKNCEDKNKWVDDTPGDKWLAVDLERAFYVERWQVIHEEEIYPAESGDPLKNTRDFKLQVSDDEINWTTVDEVIGNTNGFTERDIPETEGRYWRLYITNPSQDGTDVANIVNFNLIGRVLPTGKKVDTVNMASGKDVIVSSGTSASYILDEEYDTKWSVDAADGQQWFSVDLGEEKDIYRWCLRTAGIAGEPNAKNIFDFDVLVSNDAENWVEVNTIRNNIRESIRGYVGYKARHIKVKVITPTLATDPEVSINELEVYSGTGATMKQIEVTSNLNDIESISRGLTVYQNNPNPFKINTSIAFKIQESMLVNVSLFDVSGKLVKVLQNEFLIPGDHKVQLNGSQLHSGIYFYTISTPKAKVTKRLVKL
ncbi:DUF4185 domain-containing protein [Labilibacter sediminis]|nr:DUF4185 domain-containing protein [Labilibacter sediminis]